MNLETSTSNHPFTQSPLPPKAKAMPFLGSAMYMATNPMHHCLEMYRRYGSVFRINLPGREYAILTGLEANQFMSTADEHLASTEVFSALKRELGTEKLLVGMDGPIHRARRKLQRTSYSRENFL